MNTIDFGLVTFFLLGMIYGYNRGFVKQAIGFLGLVISFLVAYSYASSIAEYLQHYFPLPKETFHPLFDHISGLDTVHQFIYVSISFILLFFTTRFALNLVGQALHLIAELPILSIINRGLGAFLGILQVFICTLLILNLAQWVPGGYWKERIQQSKLSIYLLNHTPSFFKQTEYHPEKKPDNPYRNIL